MRSKFVAVIGILVLCFAVAFSSGCGTTGRTGNCIRTGGTISNPDGSFDQVWTEHVRDQFGQEMVVVKSKETRSVLNPKTNRYEVVTTTKVDGVTGGATVENKAAAGFVSNLPNAAGDVFGAWILRGADWGTTVNNNIAAPAAAAATRAATDPKGHKGHKGNHNSKGHGGNGGNGGHGGNGGNGGNNRPGNGFGDNNHGHSGPPGQNR